MIVIMFLCAFALSGAAAYYSIAGLMAIFAAAPISIAIMGSILELSKLVVASWLYRNWKLVPKWIKGYMSLALIVLMLLTSMGIFGYLSKAHLDQAVPSGDVAAKIALIDEKIKTEKEKINDARRIILQLDEQVNQTIARTGNATDDAGVQRSINIRRSQAKERQQLTNEIQAAQGKIAKLSEERTPIASELRKVEAEVGPIKYIAALIYNDEVDQTLLERAVRWVIIMIVVVFDPLAVVMLIAANWSLLHKREVTNETQSSTPTVLHTSDDLLLQPDTVEDNVEQTQPPVQEVPATTEAVESRTNDGSVPLETDNLRSAVAQATEHPVFDSNQSFWYSRPRKINPLTKT